MTIREQITTYIDRQYPLYRQIALDLHARPEVSNHEFYACERLSRQLTEEGFQVTVDVAGHRTGFTGTYRSEKTGPVLVFLAEYDALAGLGHGCGHNLFGPTSLLAAAALRQVLDETGGEIRVYGTPGEEGGENGSAKGSFVREGFFSDVDAALCVHPGDRHEASSKNLACLPVDIEFFGKAAHAVTAPEQGINALDALILTYNGINALRQHVTQDVRIHGIITHGGDAPNIVPEYAAARFYFRASTVPRLNALMQRIGSVVEGAAQMTGATGRIRPCQNQVDNMVPTPSFDAVYGRELAQLGETMLPSHGYGIGSSDVGNVSQVVPTIQPTICITDGPTPWHTEQSRDASRSEKGLASIALGAKALALTALDLIEDPGLLEKIREDHAQQVSHQ